MHFGHVGLARWVVEHTDLDELWMMVSPNNPLKPAGMLAPEQERLAAVREAVRDIPGVEACDFEFSLPRPSYTANTLRALQQAFPEHEFTLVIGEDNLAIFTQWREWEYIVANFRIFVYPRHERSVESGETRVESGERRVESGESRVESGKRSVESGETSVKKAKNVVFLANAPYFDISSTELRAKR